MSQNMDHNDALEHWLTRHEVKDVEFMIPDFAGIGRGKVMPVERFLDALSSEGLRVPDSLFCMSVDGQFVDNDQLGDVEADLLLTPDLNTLVLVPWHARKTASVLCDCTYPDGSAADMSPRELLKKICTLFAQQNWQPIVAPEFEFFLIEAVTEADPARPQAPKPPRGQSGRTDKGASAYSVDGLSEYSDLFSEFYECCRLQNIQADTLIHEAGVGQFELNLRHGPALELADQSFYFKRALRQLSPRFGLNASFMAKPFPEDFGSAMHMHQSVVQADNGHTLFADESGEDTALFLSYIAGLQKHLPAVMPLLAPYPNSYLRIGSSLSAPANTHWGRENRSVGLRVPFGDRAGRRVENRVPGSDVNPYLAIAATLACGYLGMTEGLIPTQPLTESAYERKSQVLPKHFLAGLDCMSRSKPIRQLLGELFTNLYLEVKQQEYRARNITLSPWELTHLLTHI